MEKSVIWTSRSYWIANEMRATQCELGSFWWWLLLLRCFFLYSCHWMNVCAHSIVFWWVLFTSTTFGYRCSHNKWWHKYIKWICVSVYVHRVFEWKNKRRKKQPIWKSSEPVDFYRVNWLTTPGFASFHPNERCIVIVSFFMLVLLFLLLLLVYLCIERCTFMRSNSNPENSFIFRCCCHYKKKKTKLFQLACSRTACTVKE